jgi:ferredoxin-NADP reductase
MRAIAQRLLLFYANRRPEDAPFLQELEALQRKNPSDTFVPTMTNMRRSDRSWWGEPGRINQAMLAKQLKSAVSADLLPGRVARDGGGHAHHTSRHGGR